MAADAADRWLERVRRLDEQQPFTGAELAVQEAELPADGELPLEEVEARDRRGRWRSLDHVAEAHPDVTMIAHEGPWGVKLDMIRTPAERQRQGLAGAAMRDLLAYADEGGKAVYLTPGRPEASQGMSNAKLRAWYKRLGFVPHTGRRRDFRVMASHVRPAREGLVEGWLDELEEAFSPRLHPHDRRGRWARTRFEVEPGGINARASIGDAYIRFSAKGGPVKDVFVPEGERRRGIGTELYLAAAGRAAEHGADLHSGDVVSPEAEALWRSLERRGLAERYTTLSGNPAWRTTLRRGRANQPSLPGMGEPSPLDPHKLFGGELIEDPEGQRWRVQSARGTSSKLSTAGLVREDYSGPLRVVKPAELEGWLFVSGRSKSKAPAFKPEPLAPVVDDSGTVTLGERAGGTQGARFAEGADGQRYVVKTYRGDVDRVATELLGNAVYRRLGVAVPEAGELTFGGTPAVASKMVAGEVRPWKEPSAALADGFMADALLANWDVVGLDQDNVLWDGDEPIRVDQGGTLEYRAQGEPKPFGPVPAEVWTMAGPQGQAHGTMALTAEGKRQGAAQIEAVLTPEAVDELVDAAPFKDLAMRERVRGSLKARVEWMGRYARGEVGEPKPLEGQEARDALAHGQRRLELYPEQATALAGFLYGWAGKANDHLRSGAPAKAADDATRFVVREMDSLLRAARAPEDLHVYVALPREPKVGSTLEDRGYLLAALEPGPAREAAGDGGAVLRLMVPKGSEALLVAPLAPQLEGGEAPPQPEVVLRRGARAKVSRVEGGVAEAALA